MRRCEICGEEAPDKQVGAEMVRDADNVARVIVVCRECHHFINRVDAAVSVQQGKTFIEVMKNERRV